MQDYSRAVIIGGGMMGVGLLYHLALEGWTDAVLIEKKDITSGSTWHAAGQCPSFTSNYNLGLIHDYGNKLYPKLEEITGQYVSWHGSGSLRFALTPEEVDYFRIAEGMSKLVGFHLEIISPERCQELFPHVKTEGVLAVAWTKGDGHVDPATCCRAMAKAAKDLGATIYEDTLVTNTKQLDNGEWEVITEKGSIRAQHVVNSAGSYVDRVANWVGLNVPMTNMKHRYVVTEPIKEIYERDSEMQVFRDPYPSAYYRQEQESMLIGIYETEGMQEAWEGSQPRWEDSYELFETDIDTIIPWLERVMERAPMMETAGIKRVVNGAISHTPDANPLLGPAAGLKNYWFCSGASIGIAQGAGSGKYLAQWMVHGAADINMIGLDPRRFGSYATADYVKEKAFEDYGHMYVLHVPGEERTAGRGARLTPLFEKLKAKGCVYTEAFGWERPKWFSLDGREEKPSYRRNNTFEVVAAECRAVQERVGIIDLSSFAKFEVTGKDAYAFLNRVVANRVSKKTGGITLAHALTSGGRIESEFTISRLANDKYYVLSGAAAELRDLDILKFAVQDSEDVSIKNVTDDYGILIVTGPKSREVLTTITKADLSNEAFRWLSAQEITVAGLAVRALRVSYVGELGWELHAPMRKLEKLYDAIMQAGEKHGIADFGSYAVNSMRMEKAYAGWSSELTNEITPIEAGIERFVNYNKDFIGKDAVLKRKEDGITIKMIYMELDATDADCRGGEPIMLNGNVVGMTTSGAYGHRTGKSLAFGYIQADLNEQEFDIMLLSELKKARVLTKPAYDPDNLRLRDVKAIP